MPPCPMPNTATSTVLHCLLIVLLPLVLNGFSDSGQFDVDGHLPLLTPAFGEIIPLSRIHKADVAYSRYKYYYQYSTRGYGATCMLSIFFLTRWIGTDLRTEAHHDELRFITAPFVTHSAFVFDCANPAFESEAVSFARDIYSNQRWYYLRE